MTGDRSPVLILGCGFLGQALCRGLVERGHAVTSFNRGHYPALDAIGVRQIAGDLADRDAVMAAFAGGFDACDQRPRVRSFVTNQVLLP